MINKINQTLNNNKSIYNIKNIKKHYNKNKNKSIYNIKNIKNYCNKNKNKSILNKKNQTKIDNILLIKFNKKMNKFNKKMS